MHQRKVALLLCGIISLHLLTPALAGAVGEDDPLWNRPSYEKKIYAIGQQILLKNGIREKIAFFYRRADEVNAHAARGGGIPNTIIVDQGLIRLVSSDDELAAVLSHEIAHIIQRHGAKTHAKKMALGMGYLAVIGVASVATMGATTPLMSLAPTLTKPIGRGYETEADLLGIDFMAKAGYNPVAMEEMMTKITSDAPALTTFLASHPLGTKRLDAIHQKIATDYPQFLEATPAKTEAPTVAAAEPASDTADTQPPTVAMAIAPSDTALQGAKTETDAQALPAASRQKQPPATAKPASSPQISAIPPAAAPGIKAAPKSVAQLLIEMKPHTLQALQLISKLGYANYNDLTEALSMDTDQVHMIVTELADKKLIRVLGADSDQMFVLTDWAAEALDSARKP